ncbi:MAG: hypothetical protein RL739_2134 [Pseudomonadota bacterium]|jgi:hypothetical protein
MSRSSRCFPTGAPAQRDDLAVIGKLKWTDAAFKKEAALHRGTSVSKMISTIST